MNAVTDAQTSLEAAERRAGVEIRTLTERTALNDARAVFDAVWPSLAGSTQIQSNLLQAIVHAGGYCSAAYVDDTAIGAAVGVLGRHRDEQGRRHEHLHSHMAAVVEGFRDRHVGSALKVHQRWWALSNEVPVVTWTFDPLVRRNAYVNLIKLGTEVRGYEPDFYGPMDDAINAGDPSDRMFAWWEVGSERAAKAAAGQTHPIDVAARTAAGADVRTVVIPEDIVELRAHDRAEAQEWRRTVREQFVSALDEGYCVTGITAEGNYVLERA
jgi:predicted GNAT superfamily acetyltransferase